MKDLEETVRESIDKWIDEAPADLIKGILKKLSKNIPLNKIIAILGNPDLAERFYFQQFSGNNALATLLQIRLAKTKKTDREVAKQAKINPSFLSLIKSGKRGVSTKIAIRLAKALNENPASLESEIQDFINAIS